MNFPGSAMGACSRAVPSGCETGSYLPLLRGVRHGGQHVLAGAAALEERARAPVGKERGRDGAGTHDPSGS